MAKKPFFTVITATYNTVNTLQACLDSVRNQSCNEVEHIIIDGASTDGTIDIIKNETECKDNKITWWQTEPDTGIYNAWNKAIKHIMGNWVVFLGASDSFYEPSTLSYVKSKLEHIDHDIAYGQVGLFFPNQKLLKWCGSDWKSFKNQYRDGQQLAHQGIFHRSEIFKKGKMFDDSFKVLSDDVLLREKLMTEDAFFLNTKVAKMTAGGASNSLSFLADSLSEHRRICTIYNIPRNTFKRYMFYFSTKLKLTLLKRCPKPLIAYLFDIGRICKGKPPYYTKC